MHLTLPCFASLLLMVFGATDVCQKTTNDVAWRFELEKYVSKLQQLISVEAMDVITRAKTTISSMEELSDCLLEYKRCKQFQNIPSGTKNIHAYAKQACKSKGGRLVRITSKQRHDEVKKCTECSGMKYIFIDGKKKSKGKWYFDDGTEMKYKPWLPGQPNNLDKNQPYVALECSKLGFNDMWPTFIHPATSKNSAYICEFM